MTTVFVPDDLRASVEGATGGQCTVLYTQHGMPSYFHVFPKFNLEDIDPDLGSGPHPAFIINGLEVPQLFVGMFQGVVKNDELLSHPQLAPDHRNLARTGRAQRAQLRRGLASYDQRGMGGDRALVSEKRLASKRKQQHGAKLPTAL